jgi:hypothetical protein
MPRMLRSIAAGVTWIAALAFPAPGECADALAPFPHALARNGCTQEDIPGLEVFLTTQAWGGDPPAPKPYIRIEVAQLREGTLFDSGLSPLKRDPAQPKLSRAALHADKASPSWLSGSLHLDQDPVTRSVRGSYSFCTVTQDCFSGEIFAPWRPGMARCG